MQEFIQERNRLCLRFVTIASSQMDISIYIPEIILERLYMHLYARFVSNIFTNIHTRIHIAEKPFGDKTFSRKSHLTYITEFILNHMYILI